MNAEIVDILSGFKTHRDLSRVVDALRSFEARELFETLFPLSVQEQGIGKPVAASAYALHALNPDCPLELRVAVESLLPNWDISVEEVVFYLIKQFGTQAVVRTAGELSEKYPSGTSATLLRGVSYWAGIFNAKRVP
jgi:hypothetical protein